MARSSIYPPSVDPGFPILPDTPEGWTQASFGDVLDVIERPMKLIADETYRLVNAKRNRGGIALRGELPGREILTKTQFETKAGDFLISRRQIVHGACGVVPEELDGAVVSNEYATLKPRAGLLLDFFRHYCHTPYFQRTCFHSSHGVDVEKMIFKIGEWLKRRVDLPPLGEQRKIAAILSAVDEAIEATQAVIDQLQVVKKAMMAELLTRGIPGRHTRFKQTEIGEVPETWSVTTLGVTGEWLSGGTPSKQNPDLWNGPIPWVSPKDMKRPRISDAIDHVSPEALQCGTRLAPVGSIFMVVRGMILAHSFPVAVTTAPVAFNQDIKALVPHGGFDPLFLLYWLQSRRSQILELAEVSNHGTKRLPTELLFSSGVPAPPLDEQRALVLVFESTDERLDAELSNISQLRHVRSALTSVLLTGELRVTPDEASA